MSCTCQLRPTNLTRAHLLRHKYFNSIKTFSLDYKTLCYFTSHTMVIICLSLQLPLHVNDNS